MTIFFIYFAIGIIVSILDAFLNINFEPIWKSFIFGWAIALFWPIYLIVLSILALWSKWSDEFD